MSRRIMMPSGLVWFSLLLTVLLATGCDRLTRTQTPAEPVPPGSIPMQVVRAPGGSVLVYVNVYINDQGPFAFALDTGASKSVVDDAVTSELQLPQAGASTGITIAPNSAATIPVYQIERWRIETVELPATTVAGLDLPSAAQLRPEGAASLQGLIGSDVLSRFGAVRIDYDQATLTLGAASTAGPPASRAR